MPLFSIKASICICITMMMSSCTAQVEPESINKKNLSLKTTSTTYKKPKDSLFFIDGQLCQHLRKIFQDSKGNLWFGTNVYDLMMYDGDTLIYITEKDGFSGGRVTGIQEDKQGNIWFATGHGLNKYDGESFVIFSEKDGLANREIWSFIIGKDGVIWLGTNDGLSHFDGQKFTNFIVPKPSVEKPNTIYSEDRITGIAEDKHGNLWLGTDGFGLSKYDGNTFTHFTTYHGLADNTISDLIIDSQENIWIGTFWGGLSKYDGQKFINYTKRGLIEGVEISALYEDNTGNIWIGVENNGVYKYNLEGFAHFPRESFLNGSILSIYQDREKRFWFGGWGGLFRKQNDTFNPISVNGPWN